jgi:hypothetical protein
MMLVIGEHARGNDIDVDELEDILKECDSERYIKHNEARARSPGLEDRPQCTQTSIVDIELEECSLLTLVSIVDNHKGRIRDIGERTRGHH